MSDNCRFAFAVHVLAVLATQRDQACPSTRLAKTVNTHPVVIRRLLSDLAEAGLIRTERGPSGGARLKVEPARIRLGQVLRSVDGKALFGNHPKRPLASCPVGGCIETVLATVRNRAEAAMVRELNRITLADVLARVMTS